MCFVCIYVCAQHVCIPGSYRNLKRVLGPLKLELEDGCEPPFCCWVPDEDSL